MQPDPLVHIIVVNWNGGQVTLDCLESLRTVSYPRHVVLLVDNGSTDGVVQAVRKTLPSVVIIENGSNLRFAGGNNVGIGHAMQAGADAVLLLNNDTTVAPDFLTHLVSRLRESPAVGALSPKIYYHDSPTRLWYAGGELSFWSGTMRHTGIREVDSGQYDLPHPTEFATGCCMLVRRDAVEKAGMLDEAYYMYTEDVDWSMRIRKAGFTIYYEPASHIWHKLSVSAGGHLSLFKMRNKFLSNFRFFSRYGSWYHWLVFPWANLVVNSAAAVKVLVGKLQRNGHR